MRSTEPGSKVERFRSGALSRESRATEFPAAAVGKSDTRGVAVTTHLARVDVRGHSRPAPPELGVVGGVEGGSGGCDGGEAGGGPAVEGVDEGLDGVGQRGEAVLDGHGAGGEDGSLDHSVALETAEGRRQRLGGDVGHRTPQIVETTRTLTELIDDMQRPPVEQLAQQLTVLGRDHCRMGVVHAT